MLEVVVAELYIPIIFKDLLQVSLNYVNVCLDVCAHECKCPGRMETLDSVEVEDIGS